MSLSTTLLLGLIAGSTILLGMPIGRLRRPSPLTVTFLNAIAIGVLLFLVWDVLSAAWEPIDEALTGIHEDTGGYGPVFGYGLLFVLGTSVGLLSLVGYERWLASTVSRAQATKVSAVGATTPVSPPVTAVVPSQPSAPGGSSAPVASPPPEASHSDRGIASWSPGHRLALLIAIGIGAHNLAEGLAIGQSAAADDIALATVLVIGFALHNATEGFGITAPLVGEVDAAGQPIRPTWAFLLAMAAIGGGPTFVGTWIGHGFTSEPLSVLFLSLAAGSILYVILQLVVVASRARRSDLLAAGLLVGLFAGFLTDGILIAAGA